jgi:hypothetical protein
LRLSSARRTICVVSSPQTQLVICDSCGLPATSDHIRDRLARLELATRYRPVHISTLLVCAAAPQHIEDELYARERQSSSSESRTYLDSLLAAAGVSLEKSPAEQLTEFQRLGFYLARLVECPLGTTRPPADLARRYGPTLVKRIQLSYKPRRIALLDPVPTGLPELLAAAGFGDALIKSGEGIAIPDKSDSREVSVLRALLKPPSQ